MNEHGRARWAAAIVAAAGAIHTHVDAQSDVLGAGSMCK
jgi:hypothetical protein